MNNFNFLFFKSLTPYVIIGLVLSILLQNINFNLTKYGYNILLIYFLINTILLTLKSIANKQCNSNIIVNNILVVLFSCIFFSLNKFSVNNIDFVAVLTLFLFIIALFIISYFVQLKSFNMKPKFYINFSSIIIGFLIALSLLLFGQTSKFVFICFCIAFLDIALIVFILELYLQLNKKFNMK